MRSRRRDARLENFQTQRLVERADLDTQADAQTRTHPLVERFQIIWRPVGGHDDVAAGVEQGVQGMTEFRLNCSALQELGVVEDQEIDGPQPLLECDRGLRLERRDEAVHELLRGQIDGRAALARRSVRDSLQEDGSCPARQRNGRKADRTFDRRRVARPRVALPRMPVGSIAQPETSRTSGGDQGASRPVRHGRRRCRPDGQTSEAGTDRSRSTVAPSVLWWMSPARNCPVLSAAPAASTSGRK